MVALILLCSVAQSEASQMWAWSFAGESGLFVTSGTAPLPGTYTLEDFVVTSSVAGGTVGSVSGGQYSASGFSSTLPYDMVWDGTAVTTWLAAGNNTFDWWPFDDLTSTQYYFFGWDTGNFNVPGRAALYDPAFGLWSPISVGDVTVTPYGNVVPDGGSTLLLLGVGLAGVRAWRTRSS
jgi:hypothetical protein